MSEIKITIIGAGFVGMSLAVLLAKENNLVLLDLDEAKVKKINAMQSTIDDPDITAAFLQKNLTISATTNPKEALTNANFIFIATPTNFDESTNQFDTSSVENSITDSLRYSHEDALIIVKSTVSIGFTESQSAKHKTERIIFSPEFLREGKALYDNLYPSRLIVGGQHNPLNQSLAKIMQDAAIDKDFPIIFMSSAEAESVKLFSNTFLAMRVAFFNELDSFSMENDLNSLNVIKGVSLDPRIGDYYNNPSFGYGGYCLPKDTKQLLAHYEDIPQSLISATVESNEQRKKLLLKKIKEMHANTVGIYRLVMKDGSTNFRESAVLFLIEALRNSDSRLIIYEPMFDQDVYEGISVINSFEDFVESSDMIVANRLSDELSEVQHKTFSRDLFTRDA
jgi:UDPglucose 6-dehydrogenase